MTAALVIIYNHQYNKNIPLLEKIYGDRFSQIRHIVPFYNESTKNVIPVFENSFQFQGYLAQASSELQKLECDHYLVIGDDVFLNPEINENNYGNFFGTRENQDYISSLVDLAALKGYWKRAQNALRWRIHTPGVEIINFLPNKEKLIKNMSDAGIAYGDIHLTATTRLKVILPIQYLLAPIKDLVRNIFASNPKNSRVKKYLSEIVLEKITRDKGKTDFPFVGGYSDVLVVSSQTFPNFAYYCGVFAASRLHVEVAIPTALLASSGNLLTDSKISHGGRAYWGAELSELDIYQNSIPRLAKEFPKNQLFIHPIKLSKWKLN